MLHDAFIAFWVFLPAACANTTPIVTARLPGLSRWNAPVDGGRTWRGKQLLGAHKTWRGFVTGMAFAALIVFVQQLLARHISWIDAQLINTPFNQLAAWWFGPLLGLGALGGDAIKSFFKRQFDRGSGTSWVPFDQIDYIIGSVLISLPILILSIAQYVWVFVIYFVLHLLMSLFGYAIGFKKMPI